ncbi:sodium:proton antiporter [Bacteroides sp. 51]|uniref:cation:proton antiporter n=1 Tax=Bacteroides sp. 51 TaxID=2302938 RepID=UPI0013D54FBE|nr:sodium:proton antiporter [Bacteroides sp. 51]NDV81508.1 sodium:proton antiporter [Bacteroides sp. 51]
MELFYSLSILIIIATVFAYINERFMKLPSTIGIMVVTIIFSLGLVIIGSINSEPLNDVYQLIRNINFTQLLMGGMLYFLLFAGAIQININDLKEQKLPIIVFSTLSVIISTFVVGFALYYILNILLPLIGSTMQAPLIYCLLFGALISPTDAVAVLSILKKSNVSKSLETKITGEALFNDGVAVILFSLLYSISQGTEQLVDVTPATVSWLLIKEVVGAFIVGLGLGYIALYAIRTVADNKLSILITLSVVISGYMISQAMEISGPLTMVSAGILIGNRGRKYSEEEHKDFGFVKTFWELIDEIFNAILFLLIGFELLIMPDLRNYWIVGILAILIVLFARYISIKLPTAIIPFHEKFTKSSIFILVWGGLRGGVSIALALSIGDNIYRDALIAGTYYVVVFSIIVQGLSIGRLSGKLKN